MALLPSVQALVDHMAAVDAPPMWDLPIDEARRNADAGAAFLCPGGPEPVRSTHDRRLPTRAGTTRVRVYAPDSVGPHGVLVYFHGGGYVLCSLDTHDGLCRRLCNAGDCIVVSVDYRLAPEDPFPAGVEDAIDATVWVQDHAGELGGDPARIAVGGDSAGGNFAAVVALAIGRQTDAATARGGRAPLVLQMLLYPSVDRLGGYPSLVENGHGYLLTTEMRDWFQACYVPEGVDLGDWRLSPLHAPSHVDLAPALVITAQYDPLRDEGDAYAAALAAAGGSVEHRCVPGVIHGFLQYVAFIPEAAAELDRVCATVRHALASRS